MPLYSLVYFWWLQHFLEPKKAKMRADEIAAWPPSPSQPYLLLSWWMEVQGKTVWKIGSSRIEKNCFPQRPCWTKLDDIWLNRFCTHAVCVGFTKSRKFEVCSYFNFQPAVEFKCSIQLILKHDDICPRPQCPSKRQKIRKHPGPRLQKLRRWWNWKRKRVCIHPSSCVISIYQTICHRIWYYFLPKKYF